MSKKLTEILGRNKLNATVHQMLAAAEESEQDIVVDGDQQELVNNEGQQVQIPEVSEQPKKSLFVTTGASRTGGANQLSATAQLTDIAQKVAEEIFGMMMEAQEEFADQILASQKSHDAMDELILDINDLDTIDIEFLRLLPEDVIEKMIRSQQSKRSRAKAKEMTAENYVVMMTGAVAELLLRIAADKPKSGSMSGGATYSEEQLEKLANDPEALKKAIRNVQSKKSIMKSKAEFVELGGEQSEGWQALLVAEAQLKDLRDRLAGLVNEEAAEALELKKQQAELLADVDPENVSADDAKELLAMMKQMLAGK